jgi:ElaB/YqjD/DUF883 family membrane-anchored ribosome-binding protein
MAEPTDSPVKFAEVQPEIERAKMIVKELADAAQSAALALVDEQKARAAAQVNRIAAALHAAGHSFEQSNSPVAAESMHLAAVQVEEFVDTIRQRPWTEIAADLEDMARHQPIRFIAGAVALGFMVGRLVTTAPRPAERGGRESPAQAQGAVNAVVAGASGELSEDTRSWQAREVS